ncbi:MAG: polyribonucleotide nucleotidyltransferase [Candidatus Hydrogenedentota bacterium]|nr:MAG: polyribonucleotide nucleotidyltransferase [Candidatus Hydrogenedentota bacterium]
MVEKVERIIDGVKYSIETGHVAKQAHGSVLVQAGGTIVLVTAVMAKEPREGVDFTPLMVDYREQFYAAGKVPGGFFKRESKPDERQTLIARLIDRPIRPLIPKGFYRDIIVTALVISADGLNMPDILAMNGASAALSISEIPFAEPIGGVRVGRVGGKWIANPTLAQIPDSDINMIIASTKDAVTMVESGSEELAEDELLEAIQFGKKMGAEFVEMVEELRERCGKEKVVFEPPAKNEDLEKEVRELAEEKLRTANSNPDKLARQAAIDEVRRNVLERYESREDAAEVCKEVAKILEEIEVEIVRSDIIKKGMRPDGRGLDDIRDISIELSVLPGAHGSALFTRGQTQSLGVTTLGTSRDKRRRDDIESEGEERFLFHYNFPPFCVGEARAIRGTGRREIGHGALAGRALMPVLPPEEEFPYVIRVVSDILESNGSSSMASVCSGSLSMMDAGVPIRAAVAGIAMGLITDSEGGAAILTDIQGLEDHFGDMDFKVAGTRRGVTALQMDIKISGLSIELMREALEKAKKARLKILDLMDAAIEKPRSELAEHAPRLITIKVPEEKIKDVIGPGGKTIRRIQSETGAELDMADDGTLTIAAWDNESARLAREMVEQFTAEVEVGRIYEGKVVRLMKFGAFVEFLPGQDGLVHISQLDVVTPRNVEDVVSEGDVIKVKVVEIDSMGRVNLSRKMVLLEEQGLSESEIEERYRADMADRARPRRDDRRGGRERSRDRGHSGRQFRSAGGGRSDRRR